MVRFSFEVSNGLGLHAQPAADLVACAQRFASSMTLSTRGVTSDAKSVFGVLALNAIQGDVVTVSCEGPDEHEAARALKELAQAL